MKPCRIVLTFAAILVLNLAALVSSSAYGQATFRGLGYLSPDYPFSTANAVSADGSVIVGETGDQENTIAFRWTESEGFTPLGRLPGGFYSFATAVSADGAAIVGNGDTEEATPRAFRWATEIGLVGLGVLNPDGYESNATGVSADGNVIVGTSINLTFTQAFRWTAETGMVGLGYLPGSEPFSEAYGVSADGNVVVGSSASENGFYQAFRWTAETGMVGLGDLTGGPLWSVALGVSADGRAVVGIGETDWSCEAFRWTPEQGMVGLGTLPPFGAWSWANATSGDGSVVVGTAEAETSYAAIIWDETHGLRRLQEVLVNDYGLAPELQGWSLEIANGISADGRTIVGVGMNPDGYSEAWKVSLPPPPTARRILGSMHSPTRRVALTFQPENGGARFTQTVTLAPNGAFATQAPAGLYRVSVQGYNTLRTAVTVDTYSGDVTDLNLVVHGGDANGDNGVDVLDLDKLIAAFDTVRGAFGYDAHADFNGDESVDVLDLDILIVNFDSKGDN